MSKKNKTNQKKFHDTKQLLQVIIDALEGEVFVKDIEGKYQFVNSAFCRYFGVDKNEIVGKDDHSVFPYKKTAAILQENDKRIIQSKIAETVDESTEIKGKFVTFRTNKVPLIDENGEVYGICGIGFDITKQKKAEEERELLLTKLQKALAEIKTLRGILPICSFCKKIRNDKGYWEQVDVYIRQHTEADISHGICPECLKKHYPE